MRISRAGLACIRREGKTGPEYLTQWSPKWGKFSLVGGHVEGDETFRECCLREVEEELVIQPGQDYTVAIEPLRSSVEYVAFSGGAKVETLYQVELFTVELVTSAVEAKVTSDPQNRWLTPAEIVAERTIDGQPISAQVFTVLARSGVLPEGDHVLRRNST